MSSGLLGLAFRAADKFFKFGSWMIFVLAIRYAAQVTGSGSLKVTDWVATSLFGLAVGTQALYLGVRDPADFHVPKAFRGPAQVIQVLLSVVIFLALFGPQFFLDQILATLLHSRYGAIRD